MRMKALRSVLAKIYVMVRIKLMDTAVVGERGRKKSIRDGKKKNW